MHLIPRLTLMLGLALLALSGGLVLSCHQRESLTEGRLADATLTGQETYWHKLAESLAQRLEGDAVRMAADARLAQAMAAHDSAQAAVALARIMPKTTGRQEVRVAATARNGGQLATTLDRAIGTLLDPNALAHVLGTGQVLLGIQVAEDRSLWIAATASVRLAGEAQGAVTLAMPLDEAVREFRAGTGAELLVLNRSGALVAGSSQMFRPQVQHEIQLGKRRLFTVQTGERVLAVGTTRLQDGLRRHAGTLVTVRDMTALHTRQQDIVLFTAAAAALFLGLILVGVSVSLRRALAPLAEAADVLDAMSRGQAATGMRGPTGRDEVARVCAMVEAVRARLQEQEDEDLQRRRRTGWEQRALARQMGAVLEVLDEPARAAVLAKLEAGGHPALTALAAEGRLGRLSAHQGG